jgi:hypothetical protein
MEQEPPNPKDWKTVLSRRSMRRGRGSGRSIRSNLSRVNRGRGPTTRTIHDPKGFSFTENLESKDSYRGREFPELLEPITTSSDKADRSSSSIGLDDILSGLKDQEKLVDSILNQLDKLTLDSLETIASKSNTIYRAKVINIFVEANADIGLRMPSGELISIKDGFVHQEKSIRVEPCEPFKELGSFGIDWGMKIPESAEMAVSHLMVNASWAEIVEMETIGTYTQTGKSSVFNLIPSDFSYLERSMRKTKGKLPKKTAKYKLTLEGLSKEDRDQLLFLRGRSTAAIKAVCTRINLYLTTDLGLETEGTEGPFQLIKKLRKYQSRTVCSNERTDDILGISRLVEHFVISFNKANNFRNSLFNGPDIIPLGIANLSELYWSPAQVQELVRNRSCSSSFSAHREIATPVTPSSRKRTANDSVVGSPSSKSGKSSGMTLRGLTQKMGNFKGVSTDTPTD